jgi:hypothetical protein
MPIAVCKFGHTQPADWTAMRLPFVADVAPPRYANIFLAAHTPTPVRVSGGTHPVVGFPILADVASSRSADILLAAQSPIACMSLIISARRVDQTLADIAQGLTSRLRWRIPAWWLRKAALLFVGRGDGA